MPDLDDTDAPMNVNEPIPYVPTPAESGPKMPSTWAVVQFTAPEFGPVRVRVYDTYLSNTEASVARDRVAATDRLSRYEVQEYVAVPF